jgi:hypothetical protein
VCKSNERLNELEGEREREGLLSGTKIENRAREAMVLFLKSDDGLWQLKEMVNQRFVSVILYVVLFVPLLYEKWKKIILYESVIVNHTQILTDSRYCCSDP